MSRALRLIVVSALAVGGCKKIDLAAGRPYPCNPDAGRANECPAGWRCGLDGRCHDRDAGAAYVCRSDEDCERGWRCALNQRCIEASAEVLRPDPLDASFDAGKVNPLWLSGFPEHVASGELFQLAPDSGITAHPFAFVGDGKLTLLMRFTDPSGRGGIEGELLLAPAQVPVAPGSVSALAAGGFGAYLLRGDGGLEWFTYLVDGGTVLAPLSIPPIGARELRWTDEPNPKLVALSSRQFALVDVFTTLTSSGPLEVSGPDGGMAQPLLDLGGNQYRLIALTGAGIFEALRDGDGGFVRRSDWQPIPEPEWHPVDAPGFSNAFCAPRPLDGRSYRATRLHGERWGLLVEAVPEGSGSNAAPLLATLHGGPSSPGSSCGPGSPFQAITPPCPTCPDGMSLVDLVQYEAVAPDGQTSPRTEARCRAGSPGDGGYELNVQVFVRGDSQECVLDTRPPEGVQVGGSALPSELTVPQRSSTTRAAFGGTHGQVWAVGGSLFGGATGLTLDRAPLAVVPFFNPATQETQLLAPLANTLYGFTPLAGFLKLQEIQEEHIEGTVQGKPEWVLLSVRDSILVFDVLRTGPDGEPLVVASLAPNQGQLTPPFHAAWTPFDGGSELVISAFDSIYAADVSEVAVRGDLPAAPIEVRVAPQPRSPIVSLTLLSQPSEVEGPLLAGYALTPNGLFRFKANSQTRWTSEEVALPPGDFVRLFSDGSRGRVGYRDGTVHSLPGLVPLAPALPDGLTASDFAQYCGFGWALTDAGPYRLRSGDGGVGHWEPFPLASGGARPPFDGGRFFVVQDHLFVFAGNGVGYRVEGAGCPSP